MREGPEAAGVEDKLLPLLAYIRQLTLAPSRVTDSLAEAVFAAGWSEEALYCAIQTAALYNYMNRILDGAGIEPKPLFADPSEDELAARRNSTYEGWGRAAGLID